MFKQLRFRHNNAVLTEQNLEIGLKTEDDTEHNWSRRIKIAVGAARGLDYLHRRVRPIIHRDVKASKVLLDVVSLCDLCFFNILNHY